MEPLTALIARLLRKHPISTTYLLVCSFALTIIGFHPW